MQPFVVAEALTKAYQQYVEAGFPLKAGRLRQDLDRMIREEDLLWRGPYVSLSRSFVKATGVPTLVRAGALAPEMATLFGHFEDLYLHQGQAMDQIGSGINTIVATGTGSGKTESFLLPIVDYCLRHRHESGVKAILIYPMNALINDQLKRLRDLLGGKKLVTFGRYTGETPHEAGVHPPEIPAEERYNRQELRDHPPDILLTNYTMLEYLLLRKRDQEIFKGHKPHFLVLDEVHTYTGILGAEVACLLRRLKAHCVIGEGELVCIGTSATVKGGSEDGRSRRELASFASDLFGEPFDPNRIITETPERLPAPSGRAHPMPLLSPSDLEGIDLTEPQAVRKLAQRALGVDPGAADPARKLWHLIKENPLFMLMEQWLEAPSSLNDLVARLAEYREAAVAQREQILREALALLLLGSAAINSKGEPRFKPKIHIFFRGLNSLAACTHGACETAYPDGQTTCTDSSHNHECQTLPVAVCRSCGTDYRLGYLPVEDRSMLEKKPNILKMGNLALEGVRPEGKPSLPVFLYPGEESDFLTDGDGQRVTTRQYQVCPRCLVARPLLDGAACCTDPECNREPLRPFHAFFGGVVCPACGAQGHGKHPEIITTFRSAVSPSVSVLTSALFAHLKGATGETDGQKLLIFSDSRQDTAHQAGYIRDRQQVFAERQVAYRSIQEYEATRPGRVVLAELAKQAYLWAEDRFGRAGAYALLTPVDIQPVDDRGIIAPMSTVSDFYRNRTIERLEWDVALEFSQKGQQRYSLERLGLIGVNYWGLSDLAAKSPPKLGAFGCTNAQQVEAILRTILDYARFQQAVLFSALRTYLDNNHPLVKQGVVRPNKYTRTPVGVNLYKDDRATGYRIVGLVPQDADKYESSLTAAVRKALPRLTRPEAARFVETAFDILKQGYLIQTDLVPGKGARKAAYMVDPKVIELTADGSRYQCPSCRRVQSYLLTTVAGDPVCASWRCKGTPQPHTPDLDSFYVSTYRVMDPQNIMAYEHSGQLSGRERESIEDRFREGVINALVCTPTLEMGIDLGDLHALLLRNVPPTPSNYAQRAGRAGRRKRISLSVTYAGPGPHDSYFYSRPPEMISGAITPPSFALDNQVVIDRHIHSLVVEMLPKGIPGRWQELADEQGNIIGLEVVLEGLKERKGALVAAIQSAFVRDRRAGGLPWLDASYISSRVDAFPHRLKEALSQWAIRFKEVDKQLDRLLKKVKHGNEADMQALKRVKRLRDDMLESEEYYPLSFLAEVGFLPRYGFPGNLISVEDRSGRHISQSAPVGITEYAPGNIVYVAGQKLQVQQILFRDGLDDSPQARLKDYVYCHRCNFAVYGDGYASFCEKCGEPLVAGKYLEYQAGYARRDDLITADEDARNRENYEVVHYLDTNGVDAPVSVKLAHMDFTYQRRTMIHIVNRHLWLDGEQQVFMACSVCGVWKNPAYAETKHPEWCTVHTWKPELDQRVAAVHLHTAFRGDVLQVGIPEEMAANRPFILTLKNALIFGAARYLNAQSGEISGFDSEWFDADGRRHVELVLYDTMPGGTGYLRRLLADMPQVLELVDELLSDCSCNRACYRCLLDYRNQREHKHLDKSLVRPWLQAVVAAAATAGWHLPAAGGGETKGDSILETQFLRVLKAEHLPDPNLQETLLDSNGKYIIRADFTYPEQQLVILTDGVQFHQADSDQLLKDVAQRNALEKQGKKLLEFSYPDVMERETYAAGMVARALGLHGVHPAAAKVSLPPVLSYKPDMDADVHLLGGLNTREERRALQRFLGELEDRFPGVELGGDLVGADGYKLSLLAALPPQQIVLTLYRERREAADAAAWATGLRLASTARLMGWRLFRIPLSWLGTDRREEILDLLDG